MPMKGLRRNDDAMKTEAGIKKVPDYPLFVSQFSIKTLTFAARYKKRINNIF